MPASLTECATELTDNAADIAAQCDLLEAEIVALGALVSLLAQRNGDSIPLMKLLDATNLAELVPG
jgi:hypothetical protein